MSVCSLSPGRMETDAFSMSGRRTGLRIFPISKGVQKCYAFKKGAGTILNKELNCKKGSNFLAALRSTFLLSFLLSSFLSLTPGGEFFFAYLRDGREIVADEVEIDINHQLQRMRDGTYVVEETKTTAGTRVIPMDVGVADAFRRVLEERKQLKAEPMIDGYTGFLFLDKNEMPRIALHWEHYFKHICDKYNKIYRLQMPKVTPHVCRHTYCSRKARQGMNPKTLQYIMGHSDICVTYNTYTHLGLADAREEMEKIARETADKRNEAWLNRRKRAVGS